MRLRAMLLMNLSFCSLALVLLALLGVEAESALTHGHMLANAEIVLKQPIVQTAHLPAR
jgi:hypothetical protein